MAMLPSAFNAYQHEPASPMASMLPVSGSDGWPVIITASEFKAAKSNQNNGYLELTIQIIDGEHKGETGAYRINLFNENQQTVDFAHRQLSALCYVTNQMMVQETGCLHNIPFRAIVGMQKKQTAGDPDYTEVKGVLDFNGNRPGAKSAAPANAPAPQNAAPGAPASAPWGSSANPAPAPAPAPSAAPWAR